MAADIEELEILTRQKSTFEGSKAMEIMTPNRSDILFSHSQMEKQNAFNEIMETLTRVQLARREDQRRPSGKFGEVSTNRRNKR